MNFGSFDFGQTSNTTYFNNPNFDLHSLISSNLFWVIIAILAGLLLIGLALWVLSIISQSALIGCAAKLDIGGKTSVKDGLIIGKKYFWRMFGLSLLFSLIILGSFIILGLPVGLLFYFKLFGRAILLLLLALLIFIPEAIFLGLIFNYCQRFIVLKDLKVILAIKSAYNLLINNFWKTIVIALILIGINLALSVALFIIVFLIAIPVIVLFILTKLLLGSIVFWIFIALAAILFLIAILLIKTVLETFKYNVWTLVFKELKKD